MENIFMIAGIISIVYLISKFIEMRFIEKENKPLKILIRDTLLVYFSVIIGIYVLEQLKPVIHSGGSEGLTTTLVFTDNPGF